MNQVETLLAVMDAVPALVCYVDREQRYRFVNRAYETWLRRPRAEILGSTLAEILGAERHAAIRGHVDKALAGEPVTFETTATRADGRERVMHAVYVPDTTEDGIARGYVALVNDITDVHAGESGRRERAETTETIIRLGHDLACAPDRRRVVELFTEAATSLTRAAFGAFLERTVDETGERSTVDAVSGIAPEAVAGLAASPVAALVARAARERRAVRVTDGGELWVGYVPVRSVLALPVVSRFDDVLGVLCLAHPVAGAFGEREEQLIAGIAAQASLALDGARLHERQQRAHGEAVAASRSKDEFLTTLSHELRTPLSSVLGWVRMLREGGMTPAEQDRALEVIERNARVQVRLVEDLLDVSRIVTGKAELEIRPVHPVTLIDAVVDSMRPSAAAKAITLDTSLDLRGGPIAADPARMQQVLWNLVANAIKFTGRGGRIDVRLSRAEPQVEIVVSDTGEGITADVLPHVFERFRQGDSSTTRRHGGLGLGLALVKHLVEAHGGTVTAHSAGRGQGATFTVRLPLLGQHDPAVVRRARVEHRAAFGRLDGCRVLVVDDDGDALELFRRVLDRAGATVHTAVSTRDALELIGARPLDVVLADLQMPGEDGYALVTQLRASSAGRVPAIAVTAYGSTEDRVRVLASGFDAHLAKPVDSDELVALIRRLLLRPDDGATR